MLLLKPAVLAFPDKEILKQFWKYIHKSGIHKRNGTGHPLHCVDIKLDGQGGNFTSTDSKLLDELA